MQFMYNVPVAPVAPVYPVMPKFSYHDDTHVLTRWPPVMPVGISLTSSYQFATHVRLIAHGL